MNNTLHFVAMAVPPDNSKPAATNVIVREFWASEKRVGQIRIGKFPALIHGRSEEIREARIDVVVGFGVDGAHGCGECPWSTGVREFWPTEERIPNVVLFNIEPRKTHVGGKVESFCNPVIMYEQTACAGIQSASGITARSYFMLLWIKWFGRLEFWQGDGAAV